MRVYLKVLALLTVSGALALSAAAQEGTGEYGAYAASKQWTPPTDPAVLAKLQQWQDQKLGIMFHWGTYSQWGIVESWSLVTTRHPWNKRPAAYTNLDDRAYQQEYQKLITSFNPVNFDPAKWAAGAKAGGVRYMVITTKHHDGFCMWDTKTTDYRMTSPQCPFHTDPRADTVKGIMDAFRAAGLRTGLYFSKADWHHPGYWIPERGPGAGQGPNYNPREQPERWKEFKEFTWKQVEERVTGYGPQDILWLDGGAVRPPVNDIDMDGLAAMARSHQPGLIVVDRTVHGPNENYITPEGEIPDHFLPYPWETCMTMGTSWAYKANDAFKSAGTLVRNLCRIVARNGNYLIGAGPDGRGELDATVYARLRDVGDWLRVNGEAIYETRPLPPYEAGPLVFTRKRDGTRFVIALGADDAASMPARVQLPPALSGTVASATLLGGRALPVGADGAITIPDDVRASPPCGLAWAIRLEGRKP